MTRLRLRRGHGSKPIARQALTRFALWSLVAFVLVAVAVVLVARALSADIALHEASLRGGTFARNVAAPFVNKAVRTGDATASTGLVTVVESRLRDGSIVHVKLWSSDGKVIWSDEQDLIGRTFTMDDEIVALFGTSNVVADLSDLSKVENIEERGAGRLLEVYAGAVDADQQPVVIESYWSTDRLDSDQSLILGRLTALAVGSMLILTLFVLPLALSLARRVERAQAERSAMLRHALAASDLERRRMAEDLHDGLIQDLSALGYALPVILDELPPEAHEAREVVEVVRPALAKDIASLRGLVTDLYPADPSRKGLIAALGVLSTRAHASGVTVGVDVAAEFDGVSKEVIQLSYRILREGLRNVVKHAHASRADLVAAVEDEKAVVTVTDDGVGPTAEPAAEGHLGLRLLEDTLADIGGELSLEDRDGGGTRLVARFPLSFSSDWQP
ncbi:histidine kinase [Humibacillus xanthopallidus]|uniref:Histidine kinase n=1 Tax=Humibacillus xanthopallidus TaxID=412689 RepID=A0A543PLX5_9MICO|nr:histidine kinase [Humibacillus xanthopallidus]TQN45081.1 histidine kinase [Humibacillus xanthopallidus]